MISLFINTFKSNAYLVFSSSLNVLLTASLSFLLAYKLGVYEFGLFASLWAILTILRSLSFFGLKDGSLKLYSKNNIWHRDIFDNILKASLIFTSICIVILVAVGTTGDSEGEAYLSLGIILQLIAYSLVEINSVYYMAINNKIRVSILHTLVSFANFSLLIFYMQINEVNLRNLSNVLILSSILISIPTLCNLVYLRKKIILIKKIKIPFKSYLKVVTPFGLAILFQLLYYQSDQIMLRYIDSPESTSYYSIAYSVFSGIIVVPMVIFQKSIIPKLFLEFNVDKTLVWKKITLYAKYLIPIGIIINILSLVFIDDFIKILFGMKYVKVVDVFYYLSFNIPIVLTSLCFGSYLFFEDKLMQKKLYIMGAAAFINLVLNLLLIPYFSYYGALVSTILSNVFILVSYMLVYWYENPRKFQKNL